MSLIEKLYGPFFDLENWKTVITSGEDWMIILSLVLIECLLSVDNAIVLAAQTQKLPDKVQQEKSLFYGLWGAYVFRFIMIGLGAPPAEKRAFSNFAAFLVRSRVDRIDGYGLFD